MTLSFYGQESLFERKLKKKKHRLFFLLFGIFMKNDYYFFFFGERGSRTKCQVNGTNRKSRSVRIRFKILFFTSVVIHTFFRVDSHYFPTILSAYTCPQRVNSLVPAPTQVSIFIRFYYRRYRYVIKIGIVHENTSPHSHNKASPKHAYSNIISRIRVGIRTVYPLHTILRTHGYIMISIVFHWYTYNMPYTFSQPSDELQVVKNL